MQTRTHTSRHKSPARNGAYHSQPEKLARLWREHLPPEYRELVIAPLDIRYYRDHEMAAERFVGEDEDNNPCFTAHRFGFFEPRSDDGEAFYSVLAYGESLAAWRLRDDRWLIWREIMSEENCGEARSFYCLAQEMPR